MATRILVPLDGSPAADAVLPLVEALARETRAVVRLLRVVGPDDAGEACPAPPEHPGAWLAGRAQTLRGRGLSRVFWTLWYGEPGRAIVRAAAQSRVDLVVLSARGRAGSAGLPLGRVAEHVLARVGAPVLLLAGDRPAWPGPPGVLLAPLDGSATATEVLPLVACAAAATGGSVTLLRVIEPVAAAGAEAVHDVLRVDAEAALAAVAKRLERRGLRVTRAVAVGTPADVIVARAAAAGVRLVAMATRDRIGHAAPAFGSVAARVLGHATAPVLFWRPSSRG